MKFKRFLLCSAALFLSGLGSACGAAPNAALPPMAPRGEALHFSFGTLEGEILSSESLRGRTTVLLFVTTFDLNSQAQTKRLEDLFRLHKPRINAVAVVLEAPRYVEVARIFRDTVGVNYPVVMADADTLAGQGPWGQVRTVPTWAILRADGSLASVASGSLLPEELENWVRSASR